MIFVCVGTPVATVITFGMGYFVTRGVNDSNNYGFWKIGILENGWEGLDDIIVSNSYEWKIKYERQLLIRASTNEFPSLVLSVSTSIMFPKQKSKPSCMSGLSDVTVKWGGITPKSTLHGSNPDKIRPR